MNYFNFNSLKFFGLYINLYIKHLSIIIYFMRIFAVIFVLPDIKLACEKDVFGSLQ